MSNKFTKKLLSILLVTALALTVFTMPTQAASSSGKTSIDLAEFVVDAYNDGWQYNYGSYGQIGSNGVRKSDCSGLVYAYLCWNGDNSNPVANYKMPRTVTQQVAASSVSGSIDTIPRTHGLLLTVPGYKHVGVYIGNNQSIDNSTYGTNMLLRTVSEYKSWTEWHKLDCIDYPTTGWYEFGGTPFYYLEGEYVVDATINIGNTSYTFDSKGTPSPMPEGYEDLNFSKYPTTDDVSDKCETPARTTTAVNLRAGMSTSTKVIQVVGKDTNITITNCDDDYWYKVKLANGTYGFIASDYITTTTSNNNNTPTQTITATATASVNLRTSASTSSTVKKVVSNNTQLQITEKTNASWYKVQLVDGTTGYIYSKYLKEGTNVDVNTEDNSSNTQEPSTEKTTAYTTTGVNLREGDSTSTKVIKVLGKNTQVTVLGSTSNSWSKVELDGGSVGYVYSKYLTNQTASTTETLKTTANVNFRSGASMESGVIEVLNAGVQVEVIDKNNTQWYQVKTSNGKTGYISSQYLK